MPKKDKNITPSVTQKLQSLGYKVADWDDSQTETKWTTEINQFLALFNSLDEEKAVVIVSSSSKKINNLLRSVDSQKRPVLLSALMICLHRVKPNSENYMNDFPDHYKTYQPTTIINNVLDTVKRVLKVEGIPDEKLTACRPYLAY